MDLVTIYRCLCDPTRLRITHLLCQGPLCVCHIQEILGEPQVKISKHLSYLKKHGVVTVRQEANWRIYALPARPDRSLSSNLTSLRKCAPTVPLLRRDLSKLRKLRCSAKGKLPACG